MKQLNNKQERAIQRTLKVLLEFGGNEVYDQLLREVDNTNDYQYICRDMALFVDDLKNELREYLDAEADYTTKEIICRTQIALYQELESNLAIYM